MAIETTPPVSSITSDIDSWKELDDMSYFDWNNSTPSSVFSTPSTSVATPGAHFSTWSRKLFSTPSTDHIELSPPSTAPTTPESSPILTPKEGTNIGKDEDKDYIPFLSTHSSIFAKWKQAQIEEEVDLSFSIATVTPHIPESSIEKVFCCEGCTTLIAHDENFAPFSSRASFLKSSSKDSEVSQLEIDHSIEVLQVSSHLNEPYFPDPFASKVDIYEEKPTASCNRYFAFSKTTRKYQAIDFEFFAAVAVRFDAYVDTTISASFACTKHNRTFFLTKHQSSPPLVVKEKFISAPTGLGIDFDTCPNLDLSLVTTVTPRSRAEEGEPSISAYGLKTPELSPVQIAREKRGMMMSKQNYGQGEKMEES